MNTVLPTIQSLSPVPLTVLMALSLSVGACNLSVDLDAYPYDDEQNTGSDVDVDGDTGPVVPSGPKLLITELMIQPSSPPSTDERLGQYIEVFNAGDEAIDPSMLLIEVLETNGRIRVDTVTIDSPQEQAVVDSLAPIEPGDFFVFLRHDDDYYVITDSLDDDAFYEYGRWSESVAMSTTNQTIRLLELRGESEFRIHHELGWRQGTLVDLTQRSAASRDITENIGLGLLAEIDNATDAVDPDNWCFHIERFGVGPLYGSPGRASPDRCL